MPEVDISIGGREFQVACQEGEDHFLKSAAALLDREATSLVAQIGRLPEGRMLLMAGLMLADRTAAYEERAKAAESKIEGLEKQLAFLQEQPAPEPQKVEVAVIPSSVTDTLAELAARAEALAAQAEEKAAG
ncbi:cell division protein ZapA [Alphaproteobacteria bacterium KMM 3653]|uniref:Cell division protein ZapA n=1 Tax=Harenicola maris TaxID=2841044 RepID=A0AAP2CMX5_9RHOB|nr:cell division protein ZapA [Harenicola maris]